MSFAKTLTLLAALLGLSGCQDDLVPSDKDERPPVQTGIIGYQVGQIAPDFTMEDSLNTFHTLSTEYASHDGVVLYFTMWCPICDSHMSHMRANIIPRYPNVQFFLVDYISGSVARARSAQLANGYSAQDVLVDIDRQTMDLYSATMGTTVVVDRFGIVQMNEDYKDGTKLNQTLGQLP